MVNIVVISHSKRLAEGVVELAAQMTHGSVKFAVAAVTIPITRLAPIRLP